MKEWILNSWQACQFRFIPEQDQDPEDLRLSQLLLGFALAGGAFSVLFALFYLSISHYVGAVAILGNSLIFCTIPLWSIRRGRILLAGEVFMFALVLMFVLLSLIEAGVRGHAVAWLSALPICAQLLVKKFSHAMGWSLISILLVGWVTFYEVLGTKLPMMYPDAWHGWVTVLGYLGLGFFLMILGFLSEVYRKQAMHDRDLALKELESAVQKLEKLNLEKNEFLGIAAHDLNNPLSIIQGYAEMMSEADGDHGEFSREIRDSALRMQTIIGDVLDVNRIESGEYPLNPQEFELSVLLPRVIQPYRKPAEEKKLRWQIEIPPGVIQADPDALHQVLENLISNAVKYSRIGGTITVNAQLENSTVQIDVRNEGEGFSPLDLVSIFRRFTPLSTRPTGGEPSTGLGLSITQKIVEAMGGTITCESEHGSWARFRIVLNTETGD